MTSPALSYWDFIKSAFFLRTPVPGLGQLPVNLLAFGGLCLVGLGFPPLLFFAVAAETTYLTVLAGNERFQNFIRGKGLSAESEAWNQKREQMLQSLKEKSRQRYMQTLKQSHAILSMDRGAGDEMMQRQLSGLLWTHLRMLVAQERVNSIRDTVAHADVSQEVLELEKRVKEAQPESPLHRSYEASLTLARKRLANLERAEESAKVLGAELERIERQVSLLREESAVGHSPTVMTDQLDMVSRSLEETGKWLNDNADLLGEIQMPNEASLPDPNQVFKTKSDNSRLSQ